MQANTSTLSRARNLILFFGGLGVVVNQTLIEHAEHPGLLALGAAMLAAPTVMLGSSPASPYKQQSYMQEAYDAELARAQVRLRQAEKAYEDAVTERFEKSSLPERPPHMSLIKLTRAQKRAQREKQEKARRRARMNTDLRLITPKIKDPVDPEVREGLEYLGLNK